MSTSSGEDEDNYWPGYVDALTTMTMVLTFILMVLGIVVFSLSQSVSRAYIDAIAEAAGMPHPTSVEQSQAVINQVVTILHDREREQRNGSTASSGEGTQDTAAKVVAQQAQSLARVNPAGNSVPSEIQNKGPATVALPDPDPVNFAPPTNGGIPRDDPQVSGERLTTAIQDSSRPESKNRPMWDPKAEVGHLTTDTGDAPLALAGADPVRSGQPGSGEVQAVEQTALATEKPGKAAVAGSDAPADRPVDATVPATLARADLQPVAPSNPTDQPGQPGAGEAQAVQKPSLSSQQLGKAAVAGLDKPADAPTDAAAPALVARVDLQPLPSSTPQDQPGQAGAGDAQAVQKPSLSSQQLGKAAVAGLDKPADALTDAAAPALVARVDLQPVASSTPQDQPGQAGAGDAQAVQKPSLSSERLGKAAVAGLDKPADASTDAAAPALVARVDLQPVASSTPQDQPGQAGAGDAQAVQKPFLSSERLGKAAVAGLDKPADAAADPAAPAVAARVDLQALPSSTPKDQPGQAGAGQADAVQKPSLSSDQFGKASVAGLDQPADAAADLTAPATAPRVDLSNLPNASPKPQPGQAGAGSETAQARPALTSDRTGKAAIAAEVAEGDVQHAGDPSRQVLADLAPAIDLPQAPASGQSGLDQTTAAAAQVRVPNPASGEKTGTSKNVPENGPALAMRAPLADATLAPRSAGPSPEATPGGVPLSMRDKPHAKTPTLIESAMEPRFRQAGTGADVTTSGALLTIRFKPRALTLTEAERLQLRTFVKDLQDKGVANLQLEAVAASSQGGFSDERRAAYSRMLVIRNELLAVNVKPETIKMKVTDSTNPAESNVVKLMRP